MAVLLPTRKHGKRQCLLGLRGFGNLTKGIMLFLMNAVDSQPFVVVFVLCVACFQMNIPLVTSWPSSSWENSQDTLPKHDKQISGQCQFTCNCPRVQPNCKAGVSLRKDGCGCCFICTRQQGDICDARAICDEQKDLYCDFKLANGNKGICRAKFARSCEVGDKIYKDGQQFSPNCSQLCTCQDGHHSCTTLCPWEDRPPSSLHCKKPKLVTIEGKCCKEWVCPHFHYQTDEDHSPTTHHPCEYETSAWSSCSQTCGMGVSIRLTNENDKCQDTQERRLCFVRPCDQYDTHLEDKGCKSTWKLNNPIRIIYDECESTEYYKPKYCSTCKRKKCCGPGKTKTKNIEFSCPDGKVFTERFMWIKSCECFKTRRCPFA